MSQSKENPTNKNPAEKPLNKDAILINTLLQEKLITPEQVIAVKGVERSTGKPLQELLIEMGFVQQADLLRILPKILGFPLFDPNIHGIDPEVIKLIPYTMAKRYNLFPVRKEGDYLFIAMSNPLNIIALDDLKLITNLRIKPLLCTRERINSLLEKHYQSLNNILSGLLERNQESAVEKIKDIEDEHAFTRGVFDIESDGEKYSTAVKLTNLILSEGVKVKASDIHIEPHEYQIDVRYRIDGVLRNFMKIPRSLLSSIVARMKILAELDIAETRMPQDGRTRILVNNRKIDLRTSVMPTFYGEKVVLRLLDQQESKTALAELGFTERELEIITDAAARPQGIILATGPTGSGKTSTIYGMLNFIKQSGVKNIVTIEDPIEYLMDGVNQTQVNLAKNFTFANGLRSILRQDPNIIFVGEIRDRETAEMAFRSSLTGHLVLSTLHTNSAVATIARLLDIGLEPYLIASSLILIISQRLVRIICPNCKEEYVPEKFLLSKFRIYLDKSGIDRFYRGKGCEKCDNVGYMRRTAIFEILKLNKRIRYLIAHNASEDMIYSEARKSGMTSILASAMEKVALGITTLEEVSRVIDVSEIEKTLELESEIKTKEAKPDQGLSGETAEFFENLENKF